MNRKPFSITALFLAVLMLTLSFASCGNTAVTEDSAVAGTEALATEAVAGTQAEETTDSNYDENGYLKDKISEDLKLNTTLSMLYWEDVENPEFFVEDSNGELVNDAIYTRNLRVEERLGVKFEYTGTPGNYNNNSAYVSYAKNAKAGGTNFDIYAAYSMTTATCAYNGLCSDMLKYDVIDFSAPWWPDGLIKEAKICDKLYFASGELSTNMLYMMYPLYFNKDLISDFNLDNPYEMVKQNTWTFEKLAQICSVAAANGSSTGANGTYGFVCTSSVHFDAWFYAAGLRTIDKADDGSLTISELFYSEKAGNVAEFVQNFLHESYNIMIDSNKTFMNGNALFNLDRARYASKYLTDATFEYGVVPLPKYTTDQENYANCLGFPCTYYAISNSGNQQEASAAALECLCSEGYRNISPALFEISMKAKYVSDSDAAQMFDIIKSTVSFDIGRVYNTQLGNFPYSVFRTYVQNTPGGASYLTSFESCRRSLNKNLQKLQTTFSELE